MVVAISARPYVPCSPAGAAARSRRQGRGEARRAWQQPQHRTKKQAAGKGAGDQSQPGSGDPPTSSRASSHCSMGEEPARRQTRSSSALSGCTHLNFCLPPWAGSELHSCSDHWEALPCCISFRLKLLLFSRSSRSYTSLLSLPPLPWESFLKKIFLRIKHCESIFLYSRDSNQQHII